MSQQLIYKIHLLSFGEGRRTTELYHVQGLSDASGFVDHFFLFFDCTDYRHLGKRDLKNLRDLIVDRIQEKQFHTLSQIEASQAFERTLKELNSLLPPLLPFKDVEYQSISILLAHIRSDAISFGYAGSPEAFFIRPKSTGEGILLNMFESKDRRQPHTTLFSQIISGKMASGDILLFATPNVMDYLSQEKIKRTLLSLSPQPAAEAVKILLAEARRKEKFGMIIVKAIASVPIKEPSSMHSIKEFVGKQDSTQTILTPRPSHVMKSTVEKMVSGTRTLFQNSAALFQDQWKKVTKPKVPSMRVSQQAEITTEETVPSPRNNNDTPDEKKNWRLDFFSKDFFRRLPMGQKRLLGLIGLLILLLIGGMINAFGEREQKRTTDQISAIEEQFTQGLAEAEAALIYENEETARSQYQVLASALQTSEGQTFAQDTSKRDLLNRYDVLKQKIFHLTPLNPDSATVVIPLDALQNGAPEKILPLGKKLSVMDAAGTFWTVDTAKKTVVVAKAQPEQKPGIVASSTTALVGLNDLAISQYNTNFQLSSLQIDPLPARAPVSMTIFSDRLYLLVPGEQQVYVYAKSGTTYKKTKAWIEEGQESLADTIDLAVDGEIFILKNNGTILRFLKGKPVAMTVDALEYQISASELVSPSESAPLYLLDKAAGRVISYSKSGKLLAQYIASNPIVDFAINSTNTQILLLTEHDIQIYALPK